MLSEGKSLIRSSKLFLPGQSLWRWDEKVGFSSQSVLDGIWELSVQICESDQGLVLQTSVWNVLLPRSDCIALTVNQEEWKDMLRLGIASLEDLQNA